MVEHVHRASLGRRGFAQVHVHAHAQDHDDEHEHEHECRNVLLSEAFLANRRKHRRHPPQPAYLGKSVWAWVDVGARPFILVAHPTNNDPCRTGSGPVF